MNKIITIFISLIFLTTNISIAQDSIKNAIDTVYLNRLVNNRVTLDNEIYFDNYNTPEKKQFISTPARIILTYIGLNALNAVGDGLNDSGHKDWGHLCNATYYGGLAMNWTWIKYEKEYWYLYVITMVGIRYVVFDPIYNVTRGLPISYIGNTSFVDKFLRNKLKPPPNLWSLNTRIPVLCVSVSIPINYLGNK
jgi:hypothetical protein